MTKWLDTWLDVWRKCVAKTCGGHLGVDGWLETQGVTT